MALELFALAPPEQTVSEALGDVQTILDYGGTVAFAVSGALVAARKQMDLVGLVFLASVVAVGGGTIRDLVLNVEVAWVANPSFILVAAVTAFIVARLLRMGTFDRFVKDDLVDLTDAAGMAVFVVSGTSIALSAGASDFSAATIGMISGVGGGMIRDVLAAQIPDVLKSGQYYATAAFAGALLLVILLQTQLPPALAVWIPLIAIFAIRVLSLRFGWGIRRVEMPDDPSPS